MTIFKKVLYYFAYLSIYIFFIFLSLIFKYDKKQESISAGKKNIVQD